MRTILNLLAVLTILVGGWVLLPSHFISAQEPIQQQACCEVGKAKCCGDKCSAVGDGCTACRGLGRLL